MNNQELESKMRAAFLEIEHLVAIHRECNRVPTLGASDILDAARALYGAVVLLRASDAPLIDTARPASYGAPLNLLTADLAASLPTAELPDSTSDPLE